ncbi:AAA family ATPase [Clostridium sartagoforme]|uniref:Transporter n=1 Tax=Clostridium sartagoforme AAU1 TaxID=1202534 RepID=R9BZQ2_9CLOT|nr:AAA family ATPase [Clostridium sartagoforme]EOR20426.1 transporter [Clostridium sartagoforme AAU1]
MLVRFSVGNFLSFKDIQEFSMIKGKAKKKAERIFDNEKIKLLKFASVFGANASGKSNFVKAINYSRNIILKGEIDNISASEFKLDNESKNKPSYFEFEIVIDDRVYSYGFEISIHNKKFISEWLIELEANREVVIFSRDIPNEKSSSDLKIKDQGSRNSFNLYLNDLESNDEVLFLNEMNSKSKSTLYKKEDELIIFKKIYEWFLNKIDVNYPERPISNYSYFLENNNQICKILQSFGTGITNFKVEDTNIDAIKGLPGDLVKKIITDLENIKNSDNEGKKEATITLRTRNAYYMFNLLDDNETIDVTTIKFNHGSDVLFGFEEESDGTRRLLDLIEILYNAEDKVYIIDELDRSLHPQLTYKFIQEFLKLANNRNTQLIITTHEARLLDFELLRQDEIWISNKGDLGDTSLYSLDEYNIRFDKKVEKAYLEGRYGGVPIFSSIFPIGEV